MNLQDITYDFLETCHVTHYPNGRVWQMPDGKYFFLGNGITLEENAKKAYPCKPNIDELTIGHGGCVHTVVRAHKSKEEIQAIVNDIIWQQFNFKKVQELLKNGQIDELIALME